MSVSVRAVHHESEQQELLRQLQTNLPDLPHERRFHWLYRANPDGPARSWFARDGADGQVVGMTSLFPCSIWLGERLTICGHVGDFAISASHRSLGPAVLLQRATFAPVDQGEMSFCYDCPPHQAGMSTFRRLGMQSNCVIERYALPLRVNARLKKRLGSASALPAAVGNLVLRAHRWSTSKARPKSLEISEHFGSFGKEFSELDAAVKNRDTIRGQRSSTHLNWRFREDPLQQYIVLTARRQGDLLAFMVLSVNKGTITIVDLFGKHLHETAAGLLDSVIERYERTHETVEAFLSEENQLSDVLLQMHFSRRSEAARVVAYAKPGSDISTFLQGNPVWCFHQADLRA
jgi:hypothetical protein